MHNGILEVVSFQLVGLVLLCCDDCMLHAEVLLAAPSMPTNSGPFREVLSTFRPVAPFGYSLMRQQRETEYLSQ